VVLHHLRRHIDRQQRKVSLAAIADRDSVDAMELRQLDYFVAVADERSFTRGARRVHVVQSAVSAAVQKLERELGVPLMLRAGRGVSLTDAGAALLPHARAMLAMERRAKETVDEVRDGLRGAIRMGTLVNSYPIDLPPLLADFAAAHPAVTLRLRTAPQGSYHHLLAIQDAKLDLAVRLRHLTAVSLKLICGPSHRLADAQQVTLPQLTDERFVDFPPEWGSRVVVDRAFSVIGAAHEVPFEVSDQVSALGLVRSGLGVCFLPYDGGPEFAGLTAIDVIDADLTLPYSLALPVGMPTSATAALVGVILEARDRLPGR
jgi:DNA-binding transcriptional LysR family regulator